MEIKDSFYFSNCILWLRDYGLCCVLTDSETHEDMVCPMHYILDSAIHRYKGNHCSMGRLDLWDFETLKMKYPEQYNKPEQFDIIAYKKCLTNRSAVAEALTTSKENIKWDYLEKGEETNEN